MSKKFDKASEKNVKTLEEIKKKIDFSSRQPKLDKQHLKTNPNNTSKKDGTNEFVPNRQDTWGPERLPRPNVTDAVTSVNYVQSISRS